MSWDFELVAGPYGGTSEGPAWDGTGLLFTHIPTSRILRYDPSTGETVEHITGTGNAKRPDARLRPDDCTHARAGRVASHGTRRTAR